MVLVSALLHAGWNVIAKRNTQPAAFLYLITAFTFLATIALLPWIPLNAFTGHLGLFMLLSAAAHAAAFVVLSRAYEVGDLSVVYPIARSTPAIVPLFAIPWLGEHITPMGAVGIGLSLAGMWLVQTGGVMRWRALREPAALWAYLMLVLTAAFSLIDKRGMTLFSQAPWESPVPRALAFYLLQTFGAAVLAAPFMMQRARRPALMDVVRRHFGLVTGASLATLMSYVLVLEALRTAQVSYVVAVRQCSVLFAVLFAVWALSERPSRARITGTLGTVLGVILITLNA